jgi:hypothetical protein
MPFEKRVRIAEFRQNFPFGHACSGDAAAARQIRAAAAADKLLEARPSRAYKARNFAGPADESIPLPPDAAKGFR